MQLDINRIHDATESTAWLPRRSGRTTAMLVQAIGLADFDVPDVTIVYAYPGFDKAFMRVAQALGFAIERFPHNRFKIKKTTFRLIRPYELPLHGINAEVFTDHHVTEKQEERQRLAMCDKISLQSIQGPQPPHPIPWPIRWPRDQKV